VNWQSVDPTVATINNSGLATAGSCGAVTIPPLCITAITVTATQTFPPSQTLPDGATSQVVGTSSLSFQPGNAVQSQLPSLSLYTVGAGTGTVTSTPAGISCASGASTGCTANFPAGSTVILSVTGGAAEFGGWSSNCVPNTAPTCTVTMSGNQAVGAIFNNN
jgi:hypothetical protein